MATTSEETRQALEEIATKHNGVLKAEDVVMAAAAPEHPLHDRFEWDDAKAGHAYRVEQARGIIRRVRMDYQIEERKIRSVVYVSNPENKTHEAGYLPVTRGLTDRELAISITAQEFGRALAALERARKVASVLQLDAPIEDIEARLRDLARAVPALKVA